MTGGEQQGNYSTQIPLAGPTPSANPADIMYAFARRRRRRYSGAPHEVCKTMVGEGHSQCESEKLHYEFLHHQGFGIYHGSDSFTESLGRFFPHLTLLFLLLPVASAIG